MAEVDWEVLTQLMGSFPQIPPDTESELGPSTLQWRREVVEALHQLHRDIHVDLLNVNRREDSTITSLGSNLSNLSNSVGNLSNSHSNLSNTVSNLSNTVSNLSNDVSDLANKVNAPFQYSHFGDVYSNGTAGGTASNGAWYTRSLNTTISNPGNIGTLSSNIVTLPAGNYYIQAYGVFNQVGFAKVRLRNVTANSTLLHGAPAYGIAGSYAGINVVSRLSGYISLNSQSNISLEYRVQYSVATSGLGAPSNFGESEVYASLEIMKVN